MTCCLMSRPTLKVGHLKKRQQQHPQQQQQQQQQQILLWRERKKLFRRASVRLVRDSKLWKLVQTNDIIPMTSSSHDNKGYRLVGVV